MKIKHTTTADQLFRAILSLQSVDECYRFFEDACTIRELQEISQRFEVAQKLYQGQSYNEINGDTGASTATICRVKKSLTCGSGYRLVLERMSDLEDIQK